MKSKDFTDLIHSLPGNSLREDLWYVYSIGYEDGRKKK
jgi:hypothetical protein